MKKSIKKFIKKSDPLDAITEVYLTNIPKQKGFPKTTLVAIQTWSDRDGYMASVVGLDSTGRECDVFLSTGVTPRYPTASKAIEALHLILSQREWVNPSGS